MESDFDMDVDYETLCQIETDLRHINHNLSESTNNMTMGLQDSQDFLAGQQFENAKDITYKCVEITSRTVNNLGIAVDFIKELKNCLEEYSQCMYEVD